MGKEENPLEFEFDKIKQYVIPYPENLQEWAKMVNDISTFDFWPPIEIQKDIIKIVGGEWVWKKWFFF